MNQKEPTALLGGCTTVVSRDSHYKGYERNYIVNKSTVIRTEKTPGNFSTHHFHPKGYMICHPSEKAETK